MLFYNAENDVLIVVHNPFDVGSTIKLVVSESVAINHLCSDMLYLFENHKKMSLKLGM